LSIASCNIIEKWNSNSNLLEKDDFAAVIEFKEHIIIEMEIIFE
jgi:hypothetical protein